MRTETKWIVQQPARQAGAVMYLVNVQVRLPCLVHSALCDFTCREKKRIFSASHDCLSGARHSLDVPMPHFADVWYFKVHVTAISIVTCQGLEGASD